MQQEPHSTEQGVVWYKNSQIPVAHHKLEENGSLKSRPQCMTKRAPICKQTVLIKCSLSVLSKKLMAVFTRLWSSQSIIKNSPNSDTAPVVTPQSPVDLWEAWEYSQESQVNYWILYVLLDSLCFCWSCGWWQILLKVLTIAWCSTAPDRLCWVSPARDPAGDISLIIFLVFIIHSIAWGYTTINIVTINSLPSWSVSFWDLNWCGL